MSQRQIPNQVPQQISSGSRVIIQSEIFGQSKHMIASNQNISSSYNLPPHMVVVNPPQMQIESQHRNVA